MKTSILQFLLAAVEEKLADKSAEFNTLAQRMNNLEKGSHDYDDLEWKLANDPKYQLPEPQGLTTVKSYKTKIVEPLIKRLKSLISNLLVRYFKVQDNYIRVKEENGKLFREKQNLIDSTTGSERRTMPCGSITRIIRLKGIRQPADRRSDRAGEGSAAGSKAAASEKSRVGAIKKSF